METTKQFLYAALTAVGALGLASLPLERAQAAGVEYKLHKEIPISGDGSWDYLSVDSAGRRLYVSHGTKVAVIDLDKEAPVGDIADTPGVHGIAVAADLGKVFVSNGREDKVSIVDAKTLATSSKVDTEKNPDAIIYEPSQQEVYAFNGRSGSASVIDAKTGKVIATIKLPGKPEFAAADPKAERVYCNLEDKNAVAAIDIKKHEVVNTWSITPGESASGMAIDLAHHRLFLGCDNKMMVMMDSGSGKVLGNVAIGEGVDACSFDPDLQLAFSSCRDGTTTIAHEDSPDKLTVVQTLKTALGAKTMTLDPKTHNIYLSTAKYQEGEGGGKRPKPLPDTFKVMVFSMGMAK